MRPLSPCVAFAAAFLMALPPGAEAACAYEVVLPEATEPWEAEAARELKNALDALVEQGRVTVDGIGAVRFHIGESELAYAKQLNARNFRGEGWAVKSFGRDVVLSGASSHGCLWAVYHFLEEACGMKWRADGSPDVERRSALALPKLDLAGAPAFWRRDIDCGAKTDVRASFRRRLNLNYNLGIGQDLGGGFPWRNVREPVEEAIRATQAAYEGIWLPRPEIWQVDGICGDASARLKAVNAVSARVSETFPGQVLAVRIDGKSLPPDDVRPDARVAVELVDPTFEAVKAWRRVTSRLYVRDHADGHTPPDGARYRFYHANGVIGCTIEHDPSLPVDDSILRQEAAMLENPEAEAKKQVADVLWRKTICAETGRTVAWPSAAVATNGDILVVFSGNRDSFVCPWGRTELVRSTDGGATWSRPQVVHPGVLDNRDPVLAVGADGTLSVEWTASDAFKDGCDVYRRHYVKLGKERVARYRGRWRQVSTDNGFSWSGPVRIAERDGGDAASAARPSTVRLTDGATLTVWHEAPGPHDGTVIMAEKRRAVK